MQLDLVDRGDDAGRGDDPLEVRHEVVRDADAAGEPGVPQLDELLPRVHVVVARRSRPVHEVEVDLVEPELLEALARCAARGSSPSWRSFHSFVVMKSSSRGMPLAGDRRADALLVAVDRGGVDVAVADLEASLTARSVSAGGTLKTP